MGLKTEFVLSFVTNSAVILGFVYLNGTRYTDFFTFFVACFFCAFIPAVGFPFKGQACIQILRCFQA